LTLCLSLLIDTGWLGLVDAQYRLRTAHWLWTGAPPVDEEDSSPFVLTGVNGTRHSWYGLGQSVLMLPGDLVATLTIRATGLNASEKQNQLREFIVVILTFPLLAAAAAYALYALLLRLGLTSTEAFLSVLVALFATRLLNIMQIHQEDIHHLLFLAGATYWLFRWLDDKRGLFLGLAAACFGFNLLTRLTTGMDVIVVTTAIAVLLVREQKLSWRDAIQTRTKQIFLIFVPVLLLFVLTDRLFHFYRFGEWTSTYLGLVAKRVLSENPGWPASWPWTYPFWKGFLEAFYSPLWGVIFFDPLFVVSALLFAVGWKEIPLRLKVMALALGVLWLGYAAFYARYYSPPGFTAWGNRYLSVPTILLSALALPAWLTLRWRASTIKAAAFAAVLAWSIAIQLSSIVLHPNHEILQSGALEQQIQSAATGQDQAEARIDYFPTIFRRFQNIVTMIREGVLDSEFQPHFFAVRALYAKSGGAYVFPPYVRQGVLIAWGVSFVGLLILIIKFAREASSQRSVGYAEGVAPKLLHRE
jgi:hypothetical protein